MKEMRHLIYCPQSENLHSVVRTLQSLSMCVCVCVCPMTVATLSTRAPGERIYVCHRYMREN